MTRRYLLSSSIGAALMAWGGASITSGLSFKGWQQINVALFAIGIILLAQAPYSSVNARIRELETRLAATVPSGNASAG